MMKTAIVIFFAVYFVNVNAGIRLLPRWDPKCPITYATDQIGICIHRCYSNNDCNYGRICCSTGCGSQCARAPLDERCPPIDPRMLELRQRILCLPPSCYSNDQCKNGDICCYDGCRQRCISPPFTDPRCPPVKERVGICSNECKSNIDCTEGLICCSNGCGTQCQYPPFIPF
ncbi:uncharacterized protein LOC120333282 [Styela clava]